MSLVTSDEDTFPKMSTAGYIQEGKYQRRHRAAFGILICVALTLFLVVVAAVSVFGWYLITNREEGTFLFWGGGDDSDESSFPVRKPSLNHSNNGIYIDRQSTTPENYPSTMTTAPSIILKQLTTNSKKITTEQLDTTSLPLTTTTERPGVSDMQLSQLVQYFWDVTSDRQFIINRDYMLSFQGQTNDTGLEDVSPKRFFSRVKSDIRGTSQIMRHFVRLLKSYTSRWYDDPGTAPADNSLEVAKFLQYASRSEALLELEQFLDTQGFLESYSFPQLIEAAWFESQSNSNPALNGFQRVFVGSQTGTNTDSGFVGLNNWIQFYFLEKEKKINYQGYIGKNEPGLVRVRYTLDILDAPRTSSFFVGTPPDFEMAVYTLCLVVRTNQDCHFMLQDHDVTVVVTATQNNLDIPVIRDAHPVL